MKGTINKKGMTLVEVIVSIAIFGIVSVALLSIFTQSLLITSRAGARSDSVVKVSSEIEKKLSDDAYSNPLVLSIESTPKAIIYYNYNTANEKNNEVNGELVKGTELNDRNQEIEVQVFIPEVVSP